MKKLLGKTLGLQLCQALDVKVEGVRSIDIRAEAGGIATVTIERFIGLEKADALAAVFETYELAEKDEPAVEAE
jgi:hypothetical protein